MQAAKKAKMPMKPAHVSKRYTIMLNAQMKTVPAQILLKFGISVRQFFAGDASDFWVVFNPVDGGHAPDVCPVADEFPGLVVSYFIDLSDRLRLREVSYQCRVPFLSSF